MICENCGAEYSENDKVCTSCGTEFNSKETTGASASPVGNAEKQQKVLNNLYRFLKYRRIACIISGIYLLALSLFYALFGFLGFVGGIITLFEDTAGFIALVYGILYSALGITFIIISIVNFAMASKSKKLMGELYFNVRPAADYSKSIGRLVVCYFFNEVALVFAIIGCICARTNAATIAEIEYNQNLNN